MLDLEDRNLGLPARLGMGRRAIIFSDGWFFLYKVAREHGRRFYGIDDWDLGSPEELEAAVARFPSHRWHVDDFQYLLGVVAGVPRYVHGPEVFAFAETPEGALWVQTQKYFDLLASLVTRLGTPLMRVLFDIEKGEKLVWYGHMPELGGPGLPGDQWFLHILKVSDDMPPRLEHLRHYFTTGGPAPRLGRKAMPVEWDQQPRTIGELAQQYGYCEKTMSKMLKDWAEEGTARKVGSRWLVARPLEG